MNKDKEQRVIKFRVLNEDGAVIGFEQFDKSFGWTHVVTNDRPLDMGGLPLHFGIMSGSLNVHVRNQFTGLTDKEGKEIYEDDLYRLDSFIYRVVWSKNEAGFIGVIVGRYMHDGSYSSIATNEFRSIYGNLVTVIGNIYQNPELLK